MSREMLRVDMLRDLKRVAGLCSLPDGVAPSVESYMEHGVYGFTRIAKVMTGNRWGWVDALKKLGLRPVSEYKREPTPKEIIADLWRVADLTENPFRISSVEFYNEHGRFCYQTVVRKLGIEEGDGAWRRVAAAADLMKPRGVRGFEHTDEDLKREYRTLAASKGMKPGGHGPSLGEFQDRMGFARATIPNRFGSWSTFVKECGFMPRPPGGVKGPKLYRAGRKPCVPRAQRGGRPPATVHAYKEDGTCRFCGWDARQTHRRQAA